MKEFELKDKPHVSGKITIIGLGIKSVNQITNEGLNCIKTSTKTYFLGPNHKKEIVNLRNLGLSVESIMHLYQDGDVDDRIYTRIYDFLVSQAIENGNISLLVPGHPRLGVTIVSMLEKNSSYVEVNTIPGISCIDTLTNDLKRDPIEFGSVLIDVNRLLLYEIPLSKYLDIYIFHVCSIGTSRVHLADSKKENQINILKQYLKKFYSDDKNVYLVSSSMTEEESFSCKQYYLNEMETLLQDAHFGTTLYIPGERPQEYNKDFLKLLLDTR